VGDKGKGITSSEGVGWRTYRAGIYSGHFVNNAERKGKRSRYYSGDQDQGFEKAACSKEAD